MNRSQIRELIRKKRNSLSVEQQKNAATQLNMNLSQQINHNKTLKIGLYLTNDGELDTSLIIKDLWANKHHVFLPIIHPFNKHNLLFQQYEENSPMKTNRYGIFEPELNCSHVCPVAALDILFTPLVAFDQFGNRLGMGGGYYDRTLSKYYQESWNKPKVIGLAHNCQMVEQLPIESWDVPLKCIVTPEKIYQW